MSDPRSAIYVGHLRHRRFEPATNDFNYSLFMMLVDLSEAPRLFGPRWLWSVDRPNVASLRRADYLGDPRVPLDQAVRDRVEAATGQRPDGPIALLTHLRYWGYCFNPISFYFCYDPNGRRVETTIGEVTNTPWGERHVYVLDRADDLRTTPPMRFVFDKAMHVSPFNDMGLRYDWRMTEPGERFVCQIDLLSEEHKFFDATLSLERREATAANMARALAWWPFMTQKVWLMIHWQALRLWWKGCPVYPNPSREKTAPKDERS